LPVGALVQAFDPDGVKVGEVVVPIEGGFMMAVYGDDPTTPTDEGAKAGDVIRFTVNGQPVLTMPRDPIWQEKARVDIMLEPLRSFLPIKLKHDGGQ